MMEKSTVNLIYLGDRNYALLKKKGTAVRDLPPEPKTELTAKLCATGKNRKPKNLDTRVTKKEPAEQVGNGSLQAHEIKIKRKLVLLLKHIKNTYLLQLSTLITI